MQDEYDELKMRLNTCSAKYTQMRDLYIKERNKRWPIKVQKVWDKVRSTAIVLLSSESGTPFLKKITMFFSTMIAWAKNGFKLVEEQTSAARFEICKACPELQKETNQCKVCGCFMVKKVKVSGASCPLNKW